VTCPGVRGRRAARIQEPLGKGIWPRLRDLVNEPLGLSPSSPSTWARHRAQLLRATIAAGLAVLAAGALTFGKSPPAEPARYAVVAPAATLLPRLAAPEPSPAAVPEAPRLGAISSAERVEAASGVKVVRNGGPGGSGALIIDVPQALAVRLPGSGPAARSQR
jgi:hypothetical protein